VKIGDELAYILHIGVPGGHVAIRNEKTSRKPRDEFAASAPSRARSSGILNILARRL
jgi:hypothetical protein